VHSQTNKDVERRIAGKIITWSSQIATGIHKVCIVIVVERKRKKKKKGGGVGLARLNTVDTP